MTGNNDLFVKLNESMKRQVKSGNEKEVNVMRKAPFIMSIAQGKTIYIHVMLHVPNFNIIF